MKIVVLSDLHLGFRAYSAVVGGRNQREVDVEQAWFWCVQKITEIQPDLVLIPGDIFHHPRVSDFAKKAFISGLYDISIDCLGCPTIVLQGNHDAGKTADVLTPIMLPTHLIDNLHIVTEPKRIELVVNKGETFVSVACFPYVARGDGKAYKMEPDSKADINILLMHAAVKDDGSGKLPFFYSGDDAIDVVGQIEDWEMIALGDFHENTFLGPNDEMGVPKGLCFYPGAIERTSNNIWAEEKAKGFVEVDLTAAGHECKWHEIPTRPMVDIDFYKTAMDPAILPTAENVNRTMESWLLDVAPDTKDCLVRLKVEEFPREEREHIDWALVRRFKNRCTHFYLDIRYAKREVVALEAVGSEGRRTVEDEAIAFFADDDEAVREKAFEFLDIRQAVTDAEFASIHTKEIDE